MSGAWVVPFGLALFGLGVLIGARIERHDRRQSLGVWCPYCYVQTHLKRVRPWCQVLVCENCERSIGHEEMFDDR